MYVLYLPVHLIPVNPVREDGLNPKSRKRIMPDLLTEPPAIDPVYEAHVYCNIPSIAERSMEGGLARAHLSLLACFFVLLLGMKTLCIVSSLLLGEGGANPSWSLNYLKSFKTCCCSFLLFVSSSLS